MDTERERRWKAELASRKLIENIKILYETFIEESKIQEAAISSPSKSKKAFVLERQDRYKYEEVTIKLEDENFVMKIKLGELSNEKKANKRSIEELISTNQKLEKEKFEGGLFNEKRYKELQLDTGGYFHDIELLNKQKDQISQLQELLIFREQEQTDILAKIVSVDGKEVQKMINHEVKKR